MRARMTIKWENYIFRHVLNVFQKKKRLVVAAVVFAERNPTVLVEIESVISYSVELPCYPCIACSCRVQTWELSCSCRVQTWQLQLQRIGENMRIQETITEN